MREYKAEEITSREIHGIDLCEEIASLELTGRPYRCYRLYSYRDGYQEDITGEAIHALDTDRVGIGWGAEADWCDASSIEEAIEILLQ